MMIWLSTWPSESAAIAPAAYICHSTDGASCTIATSSGTAPSSAIVACVSLFDCAM